MNRKVYYYLASLLCLISLNVYAEYKTTGEMTKEEYQKVREASAEYNDCVNEFAMSKLEQQTDARVIADHAMKECAPVLEELYSFLLVGNYDPEPTKQFVSSISNRTANKLLSNLMVYMAMQKQEPQQ